MFVKENMFEDYFGIVETTIPKSSDTTIKAAFKNFLKQPEFYKKEFLQTYYNCGFDGYSFLGQNDSINQYDTDLLHSFVLSEFSKQVLFPKEFHAFLQNDWKTLISKIKTIELYVIEQLKIEGLKAFYEDSIGHMVSCNFYPKVDTEVTTPLRLSKHKDVSLFTVFVFGSADGFSYQNFSNKKEALHASQNIVVFPGYLLEFLTKGKYKALEHQVDFTAVNKERFSFAFFSLPKPFQDIEFNDLQFTSESYFKNYLALF
ncbi:2OG-Fe(II) oxygenase family protein [Thalassobellus sediminis]|uniref:2OG-Fe(II) oxygenase family protein n=1 Tax=Thalassobellus sediminis TaxID=3367753 RepID=UPI003F6E037B